MIYDLLIQPFEHDYMRRALVACIAMSLAGAPLGIFLVLRRLSLAGDALSHGLMPGVAIAYIFAGASFWALTAGGLIAGILVTIITAVVSRSTGLKEDASFTAAYMLSLAVGVVILTINGQDEELLHMLFGNIESINVDLLQFTVAVAGLSMIGLAFMYRPLVLESVDPVFVKSVGGRGGIYHHLYMILIVLNLVCSFQALGTLLALGIMLVPAISARFWTKNIDAAIVYSIIFALISSIAGFLIAYHASLPTGPSVVISASTIYFMSVIFGTNNGLIRRFLPHYHLAE